MNKIKFAVLGLGFIGRKHQFFIQSNPLAKLTSCIDSIESDADYNSLDDFIKADNQSSDVVCVATPNSLHAKQAETLMNAGYHVVVEKPLAINSISAESLLKCSLNSDKTAFVVMQNRYSPVAKWLKKIVESNKLGELYWVQVNCFWNRDERYYSNGKWHGSKEIDGGTLYTQFSHFVDLLYWCFGEMSEFNGVFYDFNHKELTDFEDSGSLSFRFNSGGNGQFNYSTSCYQANLESSITILSQNGTIKIGGQYMDSIVHCKIKDYNHIEPEPFNESFGTYAGNAANHRFVIQNVIETLNNKSIENTTLEEGVAVVRTIEEMYKSIKIS